MKILIIRFSSIGDIVLTTPVIRRCKTEVENAEVHFCTKASYAAILESNPYLDKVYTLDYSLKKLTQKLKRERYDFVIDLHHNLRTRYIKNSLNVKSGTFNKLNLEKWLLVNLKINRLPNVHIVDRYLQAGTKIGLTDDDLGLDYFIPEKDEVPLDWLPETHRTKYVAFAIGGQHTTKKLPVNKMIELCDRINGPVVLLGGREDIEAGEKVASFFNHPTDEHYLEGLSELNKKTVIFNACGKFNLNQSASIIKQARYVFTHDTGLMHIAAAFKKEIFSIWGNTVPSFGMYPYQTRFTIFENKSLGCRPCSKIGHNSCPKGHFKCMNEISFDFYLPNF